MRNHQELGFADGLRAINKLPPIAYPYQDKYSFQDEQDYLKGYSEAKENNSLAAYADEKSCR